MLVMDWCVPWKVTSHAENLVLQMLQFQADANSQTRQA